MNYRSYVGRKHYSITILMFCLFLFVYNVKAADGDYNGDVHPISFDKSNYSISFDNKGISSFKSASDQNSADIVARGRDFGSISCKYRVTDGDWLDLYQAGTQRFDDKENSEIRYGDDTNGTVLSMSRTFKMGDAYVDYFITIKNKMGYPVEIGDLSLVLPWTKPSGESPEYIFEKTFTKHQFIGGDASFIYFTKPSGDAPFFLVTTRPETRLEYFNTTSNQTHFYVYSGRSAKLENQGTWRMENRTVRLSSTGSEGDEIKIGFRFQWLDSYDQMRQALVNNGLFDVRVVPGMTVPTDLFATLSLRTKNKIDSITAEFPGKTTISYQKNSSEGNYFYRVRFEKLGENKLTIHFNGNQNTILEFFSTEPVETLIKKRSKFIIEHQQHRDSTKWYNGLYSEWDMKDKVLRGPDNTDGFDYWWGYVLASDDPALGKAPFVASKNVVFPDKREINSLEYYITNFVWGGLQRTDKEIPYPYAIYGTPNWKEARDTALRARSVNANLDKPKIYRSYDYPHIVKLYFHMYEIAKTHPEMVSYLDSSQYLDRAFQTARAYFTYPYEVLPWYDTYKWGCYNEMIIVKLINALEQNNRGNDADWLRKEWEKKVKYFVYDDKYPFRSEYSIDRTAFESSYAFAKYGATHPMQPDKNLWYDKNLNKWYSHPQVSTVDSRRFMDRQNSAGLAVRGWLNPAYYTLGSDDSEGGGLSYMARMGGWSILDYGLNFGDRPFDWIQLGYASYLSSFALMNTGNKESDYGYWFPGKENDGALGWAFNSQKYGRIWLQGRSIPRGAWNYDGEADLGMGAITHTAATIVAEDPLFGWIGYGGNLVETKNKLEIVPRDGVRIKFAYVSKNDRIIIGLERAQFSASLPVEIGKMGRLIRFRLENNLSKSSFASIKMNGSGLIECRIKVDGKDRGSLTLDSVVEKKVDLEVPAGGCWVELKRID